jgi:L-ascorbate metabolism protein UlaG (beta-lactamase superfamily)
MILTYAGQIFLTDPMLAPKGEYPAFVYKERNPTVELPIDEATILSKAGNIILSHNHPDHMVPWAVKMINKKIPLYCQPSDLDAMKKHGFENIKPIEESITVGDVKITRVNAQHGSGEILNYMGPGSGYIFESRNEPTIYWTGDTILTEETLRIIDKFNPEIVITHSGGAHKPGSGFILMDDQQTISLLKQRSHIKVIAIHMESLDHCSTTRADLRENARLEGISSDRLVIPSDGEVLKY